MGGWQDVAKIVFQGPKAKEGQLELEPGLTLVHIRLVLKATVISHRKPLQHFL